MLPPAGDGRAPKLSPVFALIRVSPESPLRATECKKVSCSAEENARRSSAATATLQTRLVSKAPTSTLFEKNFINYTLTDDFILDEVLSSVTFESDIKKARKLCNDAANEILKKTRTNTPKKPYTRIMFAPSSVNIKTRYYTLISDREAVHSEITQLIYDKIAKNKKVEIAYPHTEVVYRKK